MKRTYRCEEQPELADEEREEIADLDRRALRAWLARGNHCTHRPAGRICDDCRADYMVDPSSWWEFGAHPEGEANWQREEEAIARDVSVYAATHADPDPNIPF